MKNEAAFQKLVIVLNRTRLRYSLGTTSFFFLIFASIVLFFFLSSFKLYSLPKRTLSSRIISVIVNEWHLRSDSLPSSPSCIVYECVE